MKTKPIIFSPEMVRAILQGRKTQTRRVVKETADYGPEVRDEIRPFGDGTYYTCAQDGTHMGGQFSCPYGQPGDLLWVRETWRNCGYHDIIHYRADGHGLPGSWKPSIHMPRWASRLTLRVAEVLVERVQDIREEGAKSEGVAYHSDEYGYCGYGDLAGIGPAHFTARQSFASLWDSINAKPKPVKGADGRVTYYQSFPFDGEKETRTHRGKPWHITPNPWVWVIDFEPMLGNVDGNPVPIRYSA